MRVTCPNCAAGYEVPDRLLAAGPKALRCKQCGTTFPAALPSVAAASPEPEPIALPVSPALPVPLPAEPSVQSPPQAIGPVAPPPSVSVVFHPPMLGSPRTRVRTVGAAWGLAGWVATAIVVAGAGFVLTRDAGALIAAWPPAARAYAAIGLSPAAAPTPRVPPPAPAAPPPPPSRAP